MFVWSLAVKYQFSSVQFRYSVVSALVAVIPVCRPPCPSQLSVAQSSHPASWWCPASHLILYASLLYWSPLACQNSFSESTLHEVMWYLELWLLHQSFQREHPGLISLNGQLELLCSPKDSQEILQLSHRIPKTSIPGAPTLPHSYLCHTQLPEN